MNLGLAGKVAIVTGGSDGIGAATAALLAREGARVAICARRSGPLESTVAAIRAGGGDALGVVADVTKPDELERFVAGVLEAWGRIDVLVNNAGTSSAQPFLETDDARWQADLDLKLFGAIRMSRLVAPSMRAQGGGAIVNITTAGGKAPGASSVPTSVSRAAGLALTKAMSHDLAPERIRVNTVCIGLIKSGQHAQRAAASGRSAEALYAELAPRVPLGRVGEADEAANVIAFLASDAAGYVTGTSVNVDGGAAPVL